MHIGKQGIKVRQSRQHHANDIIIQARLTAVQVENVHWHIGKKVQKDNPGEIMPNIKSVLHATPV